MYNYASYLRRARKEMSAFTVDTDRRTQVLDSTDRVAALPDDATGAATVSIRHTTAGVAVNEAEDRPLGDVEAFLDGVVADEGGITTDWTATPTPTCGRSWSAPRRRSPSATGRPTSAPGSRCCSSSVTAREPEPSRFGCECLSKPPAGGR
jgi:predicted extracellular nuclease